MLSSRITRVFLVLLLLALIVFGIYRALGFYRKNLSGVAPAINAPIREITENKTNLPLTIAPGYSISIYAEGLGKPRDLELDPRGTLLASIPSAGKVVAIKDKAVVTVADKLNLPHGLAFAGGKLYIAETNQVAVYDYDPETFAASNKKKIIDLPGGGNHFTRSILIKGNKIYVATGSSCNVCEEKDKRRAAIWVGNLDGTDFRALATGLRNSVFMTTHPTTGEIWATEMGRDLIGDNVPREEINIIREGHYGWPYCYENQVADTQTNPGNSKFDCTGTLPPQIMFQAHSAPLGLAFLGEDLLVAYHGSWNRTDPTGYKVVRFRNGVEEDFISGWLAGDEALGRPVDVLVADANTIYISDDAAGVIYKINRI